MRTDARHHARPLEVEAGGERLRAVADERSSPRGKAMLLERLLSSEDVASAAQVGADWIVFAASVAQVAVVELDASRATMSVLAAAGFPAAPAPPFSFVLDGRAGTLSRLGGARRASTIASRAFEGTGLAFAADECRVHTLACAETTLALLGGARADADVRWVLGLLGRRIGELRRLRVTSEARSDRDAALRSLVESVPDPLMLADPDGRVIFANPRAEYYFASDEGDAELRRRSVSLNNMLLAAALSRHAIEPAGAARREVSLVDPADGENRLFELMSSPVCLPSGGAVVCALRNVNDLQLAAQEIDENYRRLRVAEAAVRAERDRLDLVIDSVVDPIIVTDAGGGRIMANAPAERLFTTGADAPVDERLRVRANDARFSSHVANLLFLEPGGRFRGELGLVDPRTGAPVPVEAISGKLVSPHGEVTAAVTILHDLSAQMEKSALYEELKKASTLLEAKVRDATAELVRQNELLQRQAIELEAALNAKSLFLANMSHELRTPLNAILGYSSMLLQGVAGPLPEPIRRHLGRIDANGRHLLTLINDILDITRIEAGKMPLNVTRFSAAALVREVLSEIEPLIARSKLAVSTRLGRGVPALRSDRAKLKQILTNLLSNALKFTTKGSVVVSTRLARRRRGGPCVTISVTDTGIGIDAADREKVFQDFRQVDNSPTRLYSGTGLGLAICRRLAGLLGGEVRLVSELGAGSTFTLVLPLRAAQPPKGAPR
jgi:signal transduction histidine kinase